MLGLVETICGSLWTTKYLVVLSKTFRIFSNLGQCINAHLFLCGAYNFIKQQNHRNISLKIIYAYSNNSCAAIRAMRSMQTHPWYYQNAICLATSFCIAINMLTSICRHAILGISNKNKSTSLSVLTHFWSEHQQCIFTAYPYPFMSEGHHNSFIQYRICIYQCIYLILCVAFYHVFFAN